MTRRIDVALAVALAVGAFVSTAPTPASACAVTTFCGGWFSVCIRTLPPGGTASECTRRQHACLSSGCFHFNSPRPRCLNNRQDLALTTACGRRSGVLPMLGVDLARYAPDGRSAGEIVLQGAR
jgi:hypothetical protein